MSDEAQKRQKQSLCQYLLLLLLLSQRVGKCCG
jgi:hypothetical protein